MKYGWREVIDLSIYNDKGSFITKLDTLKNSYIGIKNGQGIVKVTDALFNQYLMAFLSKYEDNTKSDFEKDITNEPQKDTYVFNINQKRSCKLIGTTHFKRNEDHKDIKVTFEIPNAITGNSMKFSADGIEVTPFDLIFEISPFNDEGDIMKLHIEDDDNASRDARRFIDGLCNTVQRKTE